MAVTGWILSGFLFALLAPACHRAAPRASRFLLPLAPLALTGYFGSLLTSTVGGEPRLVSQRWAAELGLSLSWNLDGLGLLFALLVTGIGALVALYSGWYLRGHPHLGRLYGFLFLFMSSMLGLVLTDNALGLFVFWELTSLSSYFLIGFDHERETARAAALQALLVTGVGGLALLAASVLLEQVTGTYELSRMMSRSSAVRDHARYLPVVLLTLAAAFTKSAQFPFHFWLPQAMEAPTPVSAYLHAATMVKAGVYLLARLTPLLAGSAVWHQTLTWVGAGTMLLGAAFALGEQHFKRILAYSTVASLGTLILLIGIGTRAALEAMVVYLAAHALYKGSLFLMAGATIHATHRSDVEQLGGLGRSLPMTALAAALAAGSLAGVPPFFGFVAKELVYAATLQAGPAAALTACTVLASALLLAVAVSVGLRPFWWSPGTAPPPAAREGAWPLWLAPLVLAAGGLLAGLVSGPTGSLLSAAAQASAAGPALELSLWHGLSLPLALSALTLLAGLVLYRCRFLLRRLGRWLAVAARWGPLRAYAGALRGLIALAEWQTGLLQRGYLRGYLVIMLAATLLLVGPSLAMGGVSPSLSVDRQLRFYEALLALLIVVSAVAAVRARSRLSSIIALGLVGYGVAVVFLLFGAPDLGITQLAVETVTLVLLILAFYHLPRFHELSSPGLRLRHAAISMTFGALVTTLVLAAAEADPLPKISAYYGEASLPRAHGRNVVNVILTDFRALDTLGEITVLALAAVGVVAVLRLRPPQRSDGT